MEYGFTARARLELYELLEAVVTAAPAVALGGAASPQRRVRPKVPVESTFAEWTSAGLLSETAFSKML